ncbi:MAG: hypothetical protein B6D55_00655 [Candidatus Omnitrophica bacterium 4484_70.2]|nr:MAG: hypothetical protein B6D55_00655 [Candidatus Omnitrophica bacterium 4484_70.2]
MRRYLYTARDDKGKLIRGILIAENDSELANKVADLGYFLTGFKPLPGGARRVASERVGHLTPKEVLTFTLELSTLIDAGLPLLEGLRNLVSTSKDEKVRRIIDEIRRRVEAGSSLREAISYHPQSFSRIYEALIGAGEATGRLVQVLKDLARFLEWQIELKARIKEASTYPTILFFVMVGVVTLLVVKVIPSFKTVFDQAQIELPLPTQIVLGVSSFIRKFWYLFIASFVALIGGYKLYYNTLKGRYTIDSIKLKIPIIGEFIRKVVLSRFAHIFSLGLKAGVNILTCLDIAQEACGNAKMEEAVKKARDSVNMGRKLALSLEESKEIPPLMIRMISIGEQSGTLPQALDKVAGFYDDEVTRGIKKMFTFIEPVMIITMGVIVGGIAASIFLPLFKMAQIFTK